MSITKKLLLVSTLSCAGVVIIVTAFYSGRSDSQNSECTATENFTIDYGVLDSPDYNDTELYMQKGVTIQNLSIQRGGCTNPNTITWNNQSDDSIILQANFNGQEQNVNIPAGGNYSFTFNSPGVYPYTIGDTEDSITIQ